MDGKWNDKWVIMERKWMKYMSISDGKWTNPFLNNIHSLESNYETYHTFEKKIPYEKCKST